MIEQPKFSDSERDRAILEIMEIERLCNIMGADSSEVSELEHILNNLRTNKITPEEALDLASKIESSKEDYH